MWKTFLLCVHVCGTLLLSWLLERLAACDCCNMMYAGGIKLHDCMWDLNLAQGRPEYHVVKLNSTLILHTVYAYNASQYEHNSYPHAHPIALACHLSSRSFQPLAPTPICRPSKPHTHIRLLHMASESHSKRESHLDGPSSLLQHTIQLQKK
ncbi:hypothetical protein M758_UG239500 [Ceratodon purpureus]|nr:hypothetical protein M758_UG239500 [Ceratodon purpureus]